MDSKIFRIIWIIFVVFCLLYICRQYFYFNEPFTISTAISLASLGGATLAFFYNTKSKDDSDSQFQKIEDKISRLQRFNIFNNGYHDGILGLEQLEEQLSSIELINGSFRLDNRSFGDGINLLLENYSQLNELLGFIELNLGEIPSKTLLEKYRNYRNEVIISLIIKINAYLKRYFDENCSFGYEEGRLSQLYAYSTKLNNHFN